MRNTAFLVIASVVMGIGAIAQADEANRDRRRNHELTANCTFSGVDAVPPLPVGKGKGAIPGAILPHACAVEARFCRHRHHDDMSALGDDRDDFCDDDRDDDDRNRARLTITCDGRFIFRERARVDSIGGFDFIAGFPNGNPVLKIPRVLDGDHDHDDFNASGDRDRDHVRSRAVPSWLRLGPNILTGVCSVDRRRDRDHHDHDMHPPVVTEPAPQPAGPQPAPGLPLN